jgi:hypothetical protein
MLADQLQVIDLVIINEQINCRSGIIYIIHNPEAGFRLFPSFRSDAPQRHI